MKSDGIARIQKTMRVSQAATALESNPTQTGLAVSADEIASKPRTNAQTPVIPKALHPLRPNSGKPSPRSAPKKRDNIISKSCETREDRGLRRIKATHNSKTFFRDYGNASR
jgi:hypothetical protein